MALLKAYRGVSPQLHRKAFAAETASLIGDIEIGEESSIWYGAVLRGDVGKIRIGARSNVQDLACIHMTKRLSDSVIGDEVTIGHSVIVHGAIIEDLCLIGMGAILMDNCRIGTGSIVGAGTLITAGTVIPPGSLVLGRPGKVVRPLGPSDLEDLRLSSRRYVALAAEHWGGAEFPDDIP
jgi:carbonic anhydrase/acetyltransferase-like protein (isoleucine patch superfamily)